MSTDYSANIAIGFEIVGDDLAHLRKTLEEVTEMEPRYDPKSGARLPDEKVVKTRAHSVILLGEDQHASFDEFCEELAQEIGCDAHVSGEYDWSSDPTNGRAILGPRIAESDDAQSPHPHFDIGGSVDLKSAMALGPELDRIRAELARRGIQARDPIIGLTCRIS